MRRRTLAVTVVLGLVLVLAGCNGSLTGPATNATDATNGSGAPSTDGSQLAPAEYPPGVTEAGLTNRTALFQGDWAALNRSGFGAEMRIDRTIRGGPSAGTTTLRRRARVQQGGQRAVLVNNQTQAGRTTTTTIWRNETFGLNRLAERAPGSEPTTRYRRQDGVRPLRVNPVLGGTTVSLVGLGDYSVASVEGSGDDARITLTADGVNESQRSRLRVNVTRYDGEIVVDGSGRIRSLDLAVETSGRQSVSMDVGYDLVQVGDVTVDRPQWVGTGVAQAPHVGLSARVVDGRYVELTNEGPDRLQAGWEVQLQTRFAPITAPLSSPVAPGETVYLSIPAGGQQLQVNASAPSGNTSQLSGVNAVTVAERTGSGESSSAYPIATAPLNASGGS